MSNFSIAQSGYFALLDTLDSVDNVGHIIDFTLDYDNFMPLTETYCRFEQLHWDLEVFVRMLIGARDSISYIYTTCNFKP